MQLFSIPENHLYQREYFFICTSLYKQMLVQYVKTNQGRYTSLRTSKSYKQYEGLERDLCHTSHNWGKFGHR